MAKLPFSEKELLTRYNKALDEMLDECDWVTAVTGETICGLIIGVLSGENECPSMTWAKLHKLYIKEVKDLKVTDEEWRNNYGVPEIIKIIYKILEENQE